jgi:hypothetical protein
MIRSWNVASAEEYDASVGEMKQIPRIELLNFQRLKPIAFSTSILNEEIHPDKRDYCLPATENVDI